MNVTDTEVKQVAAAIGRDLNAGGGVLGMEDTVRAVFKHLDDIRFGDPVGTVRHRSGKEYAIKTDGGSWLRSVPIGGDYWASKSEVATWTVVYIPVGKS